MLDAIIIRIAQATCALKSRYLAQGSSRSQDQLAETVFNDNTGIVVNLIR
jgi:hypothetical protein